MFGFILVICASFSRFCLPPETQSSIELSSNTKSCKDRSSQGLIQTETWTSAKEEAKEILRNAFSIFIFFGEISLSLNPKPFVLFLHDRVASRRTSGLGGHAPTIGSVCTPAASRYLLNIRLERWDSSCFLNSLSFISFPCTDVWTPTVLHEVKSHISWDNGGDKVLQGCHCSASKMAPHPPLSNSGLGGTGWLPFYPKSSSVVHACFL